MKYLGLLLVVVVLFSCKKEDVSPYEPVNEETTFDIRGQWKLTSAYMYFDLTTEDGSRVFKKKKHFGGGRTESILVDGSTRVYPIEYIGKGDIWEFRNSTLRIYRADNSDTLIENLTHYGVTFQYQTNPETVIKSSNGINSVVYNPGNIGGYEYACRYTKYFYHHIGEYSGHRPIDLVIHDNNTISLMMVSQYSPSYNQGEYNIGWSINELNFEKVN